MEAERSELNRLYDSHAKKFDFLSSRSNRSVLRFDPNYPLLQSLETNYDRGVSKTVAAQEGTEPRKASAQKAAIFAQRVNNPNRQFTSASNAKDALVICLNEKGKVDLDFITRLAGIDEFHAQEQLKGLIFRDPLSDEWETAEKYLSGNVKKKLEHAQQAGYRDNIQALKGAIPADIAASDISVQFNSVWLPPADIKDFIQNYLYLGTSRCYVDYQPALGKWIADIAGGQPSTLTSRWGTERMHGTEILERLLTNAPVQVRDLVGTDEKGNPIYRVNEQETVSAQGKAEEMQNAFKDWIWDVPERRNRLERLYNDRFNTHAPVNYDGSHLQLPNASPSLTLRQHQKNAIWRGIQEGSGLFDHVVGAGKTMAAIGTVMESRRMGLMRKPLVVVPNHLLGQWKDEFYKLYPTANVLVAEKQDFEKDNRQRLFAQIATGDWDAVIVGHSSFKFIGLNPEDLNTYLDKQISDIDQVVTALKSEGKGRNNLSIKELEKQRKRIAEKVTKSAASGRKDDTVTFDQLGVDSLFVDEADEFKNLAIETRMSRISGLGNLAGSEKAMDLFLKCRYLQEKNDGRGIYFLTGTPISNSIAELYTMQRYLQYDTLKEMNVLTFDAWASTFGEIVTGWELDATGVNYRLNSRFAKFTNVPELVGLYRSFADVVTQQDLADQAMRDGSGRIVPKIATGRPQNVIVPRSDVQAKFMGELEPIIDASTGRPAIDGSGNVIKEWTHGSIIHRMENMDPDPKVDNALKVTHEARIAALDFRLIDPTAPDNPASKINEAARRIFSILEENDYRKGTQLVFCDLSTPKRKFLAEPKASPGDDEEGISMDELLGASINPDTFSVYEDLKQKLINMGMPEEQVKFIHDADNEQKRKELYRNMNNGEVRVLIGSTAKMGAGTNVQRRLVAKHDIDCPWRPRDLAQRDGRIIRQGNMFFEQDKDNFEVQLFRYATEKTYDARMWQTIEVKARGIEQFRTGNLQDRVIEDIAGDAANAAEMKASATGNELIFQQVKIASDKRKQETLFTNWQRSRHTDESLLESLPRQILSHQQNLPVIAGQSVFIREHESEEGLKTQATTFHWRKTANQTLPENAIEQLEAYIVSRVKHAVTLRENGISEGTFIGVYKGVTVNVEVNSSYLLLDNRSERETTFSLLKDGRPLLLSESAEDRLVYKRKDTLSVTGLFTRIDNVLESTHRMADSIDDRIESLKSQMERLKIQVGQEYPNKDLLEALRKDSIDVMAELRLMQDDAEYKSSWVPASRAFEAEQKTTSSPQQNTAISATVPSPTDMNKPMPDKIAAESLTESADLLSDLITPDTGAEALQTDATQTINDESLSPVAGEPRNSSEAETANMIPDDILVQTTGDSISAAEPSEQTTSQEYPFKFGRVKYNVEINRLQVYFAQKPEKGSDAFSTMKLLGDAGFRFAPSQGKAWQRLLNEKAIRAAEKALEISLPAIPVANEPVPIEPVSDNFVDEIFELKNDTTDSAVNCTSEPAVPDVESLSLIAQDMFEKHVMGDRSISDCDVFNAAFTASNAGSAEGMLLTAVCYADGIGVQRSLTTAHDHLRLSAENNNSEAAYRLGELYELGSEGMPKDLVEAYKWYEKSDDFVLSLQAMKRIKKSFIEEAPKAASDLLTIFDKIEPATHDNHHSGLISLREQVTRNYDELDVLEHTRAGLYKEINNLSSKHNDVFVVEDGMSYDLSGRNSLDDKKQLNTHLIKCIGKVVSMRKELGTNTSADVGQLNGFKISVHSSEDTLKFRLEGHNSYEPEALIFKKGINEKFKLDDFISAIENTSSDLSLQLGDLEERICTLTLSIDSAESMFKLNEQHAEPDGSMHNEVNANQITDEIISKQGSQMKTSAKRITH